MRGSSEALRACQNQFGGIAQKGLLFEYLQNFFSWSLHSMRPSVGYGEVSLVKVCYQKMLVFLIIILAKVNWTVQHFLDFFRLSEGPSLSCQARRAQVHHRQGRQPELERSPTSLCQERDKAQLAAGLKACKAFLGTTSPEAPKLKKWAWSGHESHPKE